jgi:hypothetical protein
MTRKLILGCIAVSALSACQTTSGDQFKGDQTRDVDAVVMTPVNDIGLDDIEIPTYLATMENPYAIPPGNCAAARAEIEKLDDILGSDLDVPEDEDEEREQRALNASSATIGSVLIPFRGVVRAISGAAKNERLAREAYQRGLVRRAFVKGRADSQGCNL